MTKNYFVKEQPISNLLMISLRLCGVSLDYVSVQVPVFELLL